MLVVLDDWQQLDRHRSYSRPSDGSGGKLSLVPEFLLPSADVDGIIRSWAW